MRRLRSGMNGTVVYPYDSSGSMDVLFIGKSAATVAIFLLACVVLLRGIGGGSNQDLRRLGRVRSGDELYADLGCGTVLVTTVAAGLVTYVVVWVLLRWF